MPLRERHAAAVVPAIQHFGNAVHYAAAFGTRERDLVDIRFMKFGCFFKPAEFAKFFAAADDVFMSALVANPDGKRRAPVTFAADAPVDDVFDEVAHTSRRDCRRHPVDRQIAFHKFVANRRHLNEPAFACVINKRSVATPAERVTVFVKHILEQQSHFVQFHDNGTIGVFHEKTFEVVNVVGESAAVVHEFHKRQVVTSADLRVVFAECGRDVYDAGAVRKSDVIGVRDKPAFRRVFDVIEKRFIFRIFVILALFHADKFVFVLLEKGRDKSLCHNEVFVADLDFGVVFFRVHTKRDVAGERPRGGRPGKEARVFFVNEPEPYENRTFFDVLVSLRDLVA